MRIGILGDGVFANEILQYLNHKHGDEITGLMMASTIAELRDFFKLHDFTLYLGAGKPEIKRRMFNEVSGIKIAEPLILGSMVGCTYVRDGSVIAPGAFLAPNTKIGWNVLINYNATIGHDTAVNDFSVVSPNAAVGGNCIIEEDVYIGAGVCVKEGVRIRKGSIIGMGAVVTRDVKQDRVVVGNPGREYAKDEWTKMKLEREHA